MYPNSFVHLEIHVDLSLQDRIVRDPRTHGTEDVEWSDEQAKQDSSDQHTKDELVKAFSWWSKSLDCVPSVGCPAKIEFEMVVEELPELEHIKGSLAEGEVQKASDFGNERE